MDARVTARVVAAGRVGLGAALVLAPERMTAPWLGGDSGRAGVRVVTRALGARDVALGLGVFVSPPAQLAPWVAAAVLADAADLVATLAAGDALPLTGRLLVGALASGGVVLGAVSLAGVRCAAPTAR